MPARYLPANFPEAVSEAQTLLLPSLSDERGSGGSISSDRRPLGVRYWGSEPFWRLTIGHAIPFSITIFISGELLNLE